MWMWNVKQPNVVFSLAWTDRTVWSLLSRMKLNFITQDNPDICECIHLCVHIGVAGASGGRRCTVVRPVGWEGGAVQGVQAVQGGGVWRGSELRWILSRPTVDIPVTVSRIIFKWDYLQPLHSLLESRQDKCKDYSAEVTEISLSDCSRSFRINRDWGGTCWRQWSSLDWTGNEARELKNKYLGLESHHTLIFSLRLLQSP